MQKPYAAVFIHGLAKKPAPAKLKEIWLWGITRDNPNPGVFLPPNRGINFGSRGVPTFFNYYADVFYGTDYETDLESYYEAGEERELLGSERLDQVEPGLKLPHAVTPRERAFMRNFEAKLGASATLTTPPELIPTTPETAQKSDSVSDLEIASWLPMNMSMGTMVAYDVARNCPECPAVDTLITLGSPLGIREVQDELVAVDAGAGGVDFPAAKVRRWINIYDPLDPIAAADPKLASNFPLPSSGSIDSCTTRMCCRSTCKATIASFAKSGATGSRASCRSTSFAPRRSSLSRPRRYRH
jgi:hypothetical protein